MKDSSEPSNTDPPPAQRREHSPADGLEFLGALDWFSEEPRGSWEDGYRLGLQVIRDLMDRSRVFAERDACMAAEFKMS